MMSMKDQHRQQDNLSTFWVVKSGLDLSEETKTGYSSPQEAERPLSKRPQNVPSV
jgi:hypothetical protein